MNPDSRIIYTVDSLSTEIKKLLEMSYADIWIEGEVSTLATPASGHTYFTLKDQNSILKCVLFKNKKYLSASLPIEGERFLIRGRVSVYTARGDVQLICSYIEAAGEGQLRRQFEALKKQLMAEGLFDQDQKQTLPERPKQIALITSASGAVLHDVISTLQRRYPFVTLRLYAASVQGDQAQKELLQALEFVIQDQPDVLIIARGGGSLEDLQAFNDEQVARALYACPIPTISAIGHETDFVITDFVADKRAPTPTAAATLVTPDIREIKTALQQQCSALDYYIQQRLDNQQQRLDLVSQGLKHPHDRLTLQAGELMRWNLKLDAAHQSTLRQNRQRFDRLQSSLRQQSPGNRLNANKYALLALKERLDHAVDRILSREKSRIEQASAQLQVLGPIKTLGRGYAILQNQHGDILKSTHQIEAGESIQARLHEGTFNAIVERKID